uniref:Uncharacterized protein n=1 Tax=Fagus sylvatica TaxID=28930 RepID=A0A2N9HXK7_FAGSY
MLRMSKDHRSAGLWWSLPLSGVSFGGHGSFLGLLRSSFVFLIISCHVWSCGRWSCDGVYRDQWAMRRTSLLPSIMKPGDPFFPPWKYVPLDFDSSSFASEKEREKGHHVGTFSLSFL